MTARAVPSADISPADFFERWVPEAVQSDPDRHTRIGDLAATIQFELEGEGGGPWCIEIERESVLGWSGRATDPDVTLTLHIDTWRKLNAGELAAPTAMMKGLLRFRGNLYVALKMHFILG